MSDQFPKELQDAIREEIGVTDEVLTRLAREYITSYENYTKSVGAPVITDLRADDAHAIISMDSISVINNETWSAFKSRMTERAGLREDAQNVWMANWANKASDRPTPWLGDCGQAPNAAELPEAFRHGLTRLLRSCVPYRSTSSALELFGAPVHTDLDMVRSIARKYGDLKNFTIEGMGESSENPEFRWSRQLVTLLGLGFEFFREVASQMAAYDDAWGGWLMASDEELKADAIKARDICGYPAALFRIGLPAARAVCGHVPNAETTQPSWLRQLIVLHMLKHVRYVPDWEGKKWLHVAYAGERALVPINPDGLAQSLSSMANMSALSAICRHLDLGDVPPVGGTRFHEYCRDVFDKMHPTSFVETVGLVKRDDVLASTGVNFGTEFTLRSEFRWVDPGIEVRDVASVDLTSGRVDKNARLVGADVLNISWPFKGLSMDDKMDWLSSVPDKVEAKLPSEIIRQKILNVNTLGEPEGFWTMLDGLIITDLIRDQLVGCEIGRTLKKEFPLVFVFPIGHEMETTTNQGKTTLALLVANVLVPGLVPDQTMKTTSAPAQRTMSMNMAKNGTALFDEFTMPQAPEHMLSASSLQSWATGVGGGPGRAGENAESIKLRHPLFFTAKLCDFPPDIINRMFPCFMDAIDSTNSLSGQQLTELTSGAVAPFVRLSALMWIRENNIIERVRAIKTVTQGFGRFTGHTSIMSLLTNDLTNVKRYMKAAEKQCADQLRAAENSGLAENIGASVSFDPVYYFSQLRDSTLDVLCQQFRTEPTSPIDALRLIVEDQQRRVFNSVLSANKCREAAAIRLFKKSIADGRMCAKGYTLSLVSVKTGRGRPTETVKLEKDSARESVPATVLT